jgi:hypothetical protein
MVNKDFYSRFCIVQIDSSFRFLIRSKINNKLIGIDITYSDTFDPLFYKLYLHIVFVIWKLFGRI